jgi:hypothetical protein
VKKLVLSLAAVVLLGIALLMPAIADDEVDATVTPLVLAVNVNPTSIDYGALAPSPANDDRTQAVSEILTATNAGSVAVDLMIRGSDAVPTVDTEATWTLDCSPADRGTVSADQFAHRYRVTPFDDATAQALCSGSDKTLASGVAPLGTSDFVLQMNMPTSTTGFSLRTTTVTVIAVEP